MDRRQAIWFLQHGAKVRHISWPADDCIRLEFGCITTQTNRVFEEDEFWSVYTDAFFYDGWSFTDPFRDMAVRTVADATDDLRIGWAEDDLRSMACEVMCGSRACPPKSAEQAQILWHSDSYVYRLVSDRGEDYLPGYAFSPMVLPTIAEYLISNGIAKSADAIKSVPYTPTTPI